MAKKTKSGSGKNGGCRRGLQLQTVNFDDGDAFAELEERVLRDSLLERANDCPAADAFMAIFGFSRVTP